MTHDFSIQSANTTSFIGDYDHATAAYTLRNGALRIVRFSCGLQYVQRGDFLFGKFGRVSSNIAVGPVDDFGCVCDLSDETHDALEVSLAA